MNKDYYFSIGEFAKLFKVSKQTLLYYERNKIFAPAFIDENGYRYYSLDQYFIFEIIINLRKLDLPLQTIAAYIKNRSLDKLQNVFINKQHEYKKQIAILERNIANLGVKVHNLEKLKNLRLNQITLEDLPEEYLITSTFHNQQTTMKEKLIEIAIHNLPFATSNILNEYLSGYILTQDQLVAGNYLNLAQIFTKVSNPDEYEQVQIKPAGLYANIVVPRGYHTNYLPAINKIFDFMERNDLYLFGNAYISQLRNYWSTANKEDYITHISIHVEYKNKLNN